MRLTVFQIVLLPPAETMDENTSRVIAVAMFLLAASLPSCGGGSTGVDCSPSTTTETSGAARLLSAVVDTQRAERTQRQHLEALFNR